MGNKEKVAIVTGANTGLGLETSLELAKAGCMVVLACRSEEKARLAERKIKRKAPNARLDFIKLDLIDRPGIKKFTEEFSKRYDHLDILVNNAGVMGPPYTITQNNLPLSIKK